MTPNRPAMPTSHPVTGLAAPRIGYGLPGAPLVVLMHDWFSQLEHAIDYAAQLVGRGFRVFVIDADAPATVDRVRHAIQIAAHEGSTRFGVAGFARDGWLALLSLDEHGDAVVLHSPFSGSVSEARVPAGPADTVIPEHLLTGMIAEVAHTAARTADPSLVNDSFRRLVEHLMTNEQ